MIHLRALRLPLASGQSDSEAFPFSLPAWRGLDELTFTTPVTFFVGENGSGKSTLLEALALAAGAITAGSDGVERDPTLDSVRRFGAALRLVWNRRTRKGFFLRAEDFFGYIKRLSRTRQELEAELRRVDEEYRGRSATARGLARMPAAGQLHAMGSQYARDLNAVSHGEGYITFFQSRFRPGGLYLLDEPEAPLSPTRQLAFLALMKQAEQQQAQFIIATHSPILLAYPGATILNFDAQPLQPAAYDALEHVALTRDFLRNPGQFLQHL